MTGNSYFADTNLEAVTRPGRPVPEAAPAQVAETESETRFRTIFESAAIGISVNTLEGRPILSNPALQNMLGYSEAELRAMLYTEFTYPDDRQLDSQRYQELTSGKNDSYRVEKRYIRKDGQIIWGRLTVSLLRQPDQETTQFVAMVEDITDRKKAENELLQSEERWRSLAGNAPDIILTVDPPGNIRYANRGFEGTPPDQLVGRKVYDCVLLEHRDQLRTGFKQVVQFGKPAKIEFSGTGQPGVLSWYLANMAPIVVQERVIGVTVVISDITERKQMEDELRDYAHRLETFREIDQAILSAQSPSSIVMGAMQHMRELVPCHWVGGAIMDDDSQELNALVVRDGDGSRSISNAAELLSGFSFPELRKDKFHEVGDLDRLRRLNPFEEMLQKSGYRAYILLPLLMQNEFLGVFAMASRFPNSLKPGHLEIAAEVAALLSVAIAQSRLLTRSQRRASELEILGQVSTALRQVRSYPEMLPMLVRQAQEALQAETCGLFLLENERFVLAAGESPFKQGMNGDFPEKQNGLWQAAQADGPTSFVAPSISDLPATDDFSRTFKPGTPLVAFVPLRSAETTIGLFSLAFRRRDALTQSKRKLLEAVVDMACNALQRAQALFTLEKQVSDRTRRLRVLYQVTTAASETDDLQTMLQGSLEAVLAALPESAGSIQLLDEVRCNPVRVVERGLPAEVVADLKAGFESGTPWENVIHEGLSLRLTRGLAKRRLPESIQRQGFQAYLGVPIRVGGQTVGVLSVFLLSEPQLAMGDLEVLTAVSGQLGRAVERFELRKKAEQSIVVEERQRLARELHDSITQLLCSQSLLAETGRRFVEAGDREQALPYLTQLTETAHQALKEMRLMIYDLRPSMLEKEGLLRALNYRLEAVEQRAGIQTRLVSSLKVVLSRQQEETLYRAAQELLNNILKHAEATLVTVYLRDAPGRVELEVVDTGKGFDPLAASSGFGLRSIRERAESLGGTLSISSQPGAGCSAKVSLCVASEMAA
jgi:PAS domain S-box-containing protein